MSSPHPLPNQHCPHEACGERTIERLRQLPMAVIVRAYGEVGPCHSVTKVIVTLWA